MFIIRPGKYTVKLFNRKDFVFAISFFLTYYFL